MAMPYPNKISLRASNGQYVCAEGGGGQVVVANRGAIGPWETGSRKASSPSMVVL
jgi:hypothetical protein